MTEYRKGVPDEYSNPPSERHSFLRSVGHSEHVIGSTRQYESLVVPQLGLAVLAAGADQKVGNPLVAQIAIESARQLFMPSSSSLPEGGVAQAVSGFLETAHKRLIDHEGDSSTSITVLKFTDDPDMPVVRIYNLGKNTASVLKPDGTVLNAAPAQPSPPSFLEDTNVAGQLTLPLSRGDRFLVTNGLGTLRDDQLRSTLWHSKSPKEAADSVVMSVVNNIGRSSLRTDAVAMVIDTPRKP